MKGKTKGDGGARGRLRQYFIENVGKVVTSTKLQEVAGISEWGRRVRELRQYEGMKIHTHNDDSSLKPWEYKLVDLKPQPIFDSGISKEVRAFVLDRNGFTCQMCGAAAGEPHPDDNGRKTRLHIGHIIDLSMGGTNDPGNLRALCSVCNEGASNVTLERPKSEKLLVQLRRAPGVEQVKVLEWLIAKFPKQAQELVKS
ncbi:MAG: HNH endonuclease [Bacteroidota bacterium]